MRQKTRWFTLDAGMIPDPPLRVYRIYENDEIMLLQRWDETESQWIDTPGLSAVSGIGGVDHYQEISRDEALAIIGALSGTDSAEANLMRGLPKAQSAGSFP